MCTCLSCRHMRRGLHVQSSSALAPAFAFPCFRFPRWAYVCRKFGSRALPGLASSSAWGCARSVLARVARIEQRSRASLFVGRRRIRAKEATALVFPIALRPAIVGPLSGSFGRQLWLPAQPRAVLHHAVVLIDGLRIRRRKLMLAALPIVGPVVRGAGHGPACLALVLNGEGCAAQPIPVGGANACSRIVLQMAALCQRGVVCSPVVVGLVCACVGFCPCPIPQCSASPAPTGTQRCWALSGSDLRCGSWANCSDAGHGLEQLSDLGKLKRRQTNA